MSGAVAALVVSILMVAATASTPANGQISDEQRTAAYRGGPFVASNSTDPLLGDGATLQCIPQLAPCDDFVLTAALAPDYLRTHPSATIKVDLTSDNGTSDYDLYVLDENGAYVAIGYNAGGTEAVEFPALGGIQRYTIRAVPFSRNAVAYSARVSLLAADPSGDSDGDGVSQCLRPVSWNAERFDCQHGRMLGDRGVYARVRPRPPTRRRGSGHRFGDQPVP